MSKIDRDLEYTPDKIDAQGWGKTYHKDKQGYIDKPGKNQAHHFLK